MSPKTITIRSGTLARRLATATRTARERAAAAWLTAAGLGLITAAFWTWTLAAGLASAGISCLVMEWRIRG